MAKNLEKIAKRGDPFRKVLPYAPARNVYKACKPMYKDKVYVISKCNYRK